MLWIIGGFVLFNALFVAAEFGLIGAPRAAIEHRAAQGDRLSARVLDLLTTTIRQDRYIATSQLGITLASLGLGMYGEHAMAARIEPHLLLPASLRVVTAHGIAGILAVAGLTCVHIVIGEMLPKTIALQRPEAIARLLYWPMSVALALTYPIVAALSLAARACLRVMGVQRHVTSQQESYTPEELQLIVEESEEGGALRAESGRLLRELFDFGDLTAGQVMVPRMRVIGIPSGATAQDVRRILSRSHHTRYPVYVDDLDHIVGMLHVKDLLRRLVANEPVAPSDVRPIPVVPDSAPLDDVLTTMQRAHAHLAVVIDEHGGTAGVVSLDDLVEEVVGEIEDGAPDEPRVIHQADGALLVPGTLRVDELGTALDLELEHHDVDSVGGLVVARLGRMPVVGDAVDYGRVHLEVTAVSGRAVRDVRVTLRPVADGPNAL
jgi:CBS domain containing-hemolysin-like protein